MPEVYLQPHPNKPDCGQWMLRSDHPAIKYPTPLPFGDTASEDDVRSYVTDTLGVAIPSGRQMQ